jgi:hypothetical protein
MMWKFEIPATARTPAVTFDFAENRLKLAGESYPEDVTEFYKPVFEALIPIWPSSARAVAASTSSSSTSIRAAPRPS